MVFDEFLSNSSVKICILNRTQEIAQFLDESLLLVLVLHLIRNLNKQSVVYFPMKHAQ